MKITIKRKDNPDLVIDYPDAVDIIFESLHEENDNESDEATKEKQH